MWGVCVNIDDNIDGKSMIWRGNIDEKRKNIDGKSKRKGKNDGIVNMNI